MIDYNGLVVASLKKLGKEGDANAYMELGKRYELGLHYDSDDFCDQDFDEAIKYYELAGDIDSSLYITIGNKFLIGSKYGLKQNAETAFKYYKKAGSILRSKRELITAIRAQLLGTYEFMDINNIGTVFHDFYLNLKAEDKTDYCYEIDAGDFLCYGLGNAATAPYNALCYYANGLSNFRMKMTQHIKRINYSFENENELMMKQIKPLILNLPYKGREFKKRSYPTQHMSIEECLYKNGKNSLYKLGFCYEYGLLGLKRDMKEAISCYKKALTKGNYQAGIKLCYMNLDDQKYLQDYYQRTTIALQDHMVNLIAKYTPDPLEREDTLRILKMYRCHMQDERKKNKY